MIYGYLGTVDTVKPYRRSFGNGFGITLITIDSPYKFFCTMYKEENENLQRVSLTQFCDLTKDEHPVIRLRDIKPKF